MQLAERFCGMYFTPEDKDIIKLELLRKKRDLRHYIFNFLGFPDVNGAVIRRARFI